MLNRNKYIDNYEKLWLLVIYKFHKTHMFTNAYQSGFLSILYSIGSKPLQIWDKSSIYFFISSTEWSYQETHRSRYPILSFRDYGHQYYYCVHNLPSSPEIDTRNKAAVLGDDHQKCNILVNIVKKIFYLWSASSRW